MSQFASDLPEVIVKPGKMITTSKLKALVVVLALLLYVYLLMFIKSFYLKSKRLDRILEMTMETHRKMQNVHNLDHNLAVRMAQLDKMYEDY